MDARTLRYYCDLILWRGGEALPQDMVKDFLGRGPRPDSFFKESSGGVDAIRRGLTGPAGCDNA